MGFRGMSVFGLLEYLIQNKVWIYFQNRISADTKIWTFVLTTLLKKYSYATRYGVKKEKFTYTGKKNEE